jgi:hypothetical protein
MGYEVLKMAKSTMFAVPVDIRTMPDKLGAGAQYVIVNNITSI